MRVSLVAMAIVLAAGVQARGEGLDAGQVSADAKWLIHLDFSAASDSKVVQHLHEKRLSQGKAKERLEKLSEKIGMDPIKDLISITLYDTRFVPHQGVAIVRARNLDKERLLALLKKKEPDHKVQQHGGHQLYTWVRKKGKRSGHQVTGCFHGDKTVVFGRDVHQVKAALDVLDGRSGKLASDSPLAAKAAAGTILLVRASGIAGADTPFKSEVVRRSERLSLAAGEHDGKAFIDGQLVAETAQVANQLRTIVKGFRALAQLRHGNEEEFKPILKGLSVTSSQQTVSIKLQVQLEDLKKVADKLRQHKKQWKKGKHRHHKGGKGHRDKGRHGRHKHHEHQQKEKQPD